MWAKDILSPLSICWRKLNPDLFNDPIFSRPPLIYLPLFLSEELLYKTNNNSASKTIVPSCLQAVGIVCGEPLIRLIFIQLIITQMVKIGHTTNKSMW